MILFLNCRTIFFYNYLPLKMIQVDSIFHRKFLPKMTVLPLEPAQVQLEPAQVLKWPINGPAVWTTQLIEICGFDRFFFRDESQVPKMESRNSDT